MVGSSSRIHGRGWREAIAEAHDIIGAHIMARLGHVQYVCGIDPVFAGLHTYTDIKGGGSYRETAHCAYDFNLSGPVDRRVTTIIVPYTPRTGWGAPHTLVHELGHALDETLDFKHTAEPVTDYAKTNRMEAFAEAFTSWCWPSEGYDRPDDRTLALFRSL